MTKIFVELHNERSPRSSWSPTIQLKQLSNNGWGMGWIPIYHKRDVTTEENKWATRSICQNVNEESESCYLEVKKELVGRTT